jgi:hypothetical protein
MLKECHVRLFGVGFDLKISTFRLITFWSRLKVLFLKFMELWIIQSLTSLSWNSFYFCKLQAALFHHRNYLTHKIKLNFPLKNEKERCSSNLKENEWNKLISKWSLWNFLILYISFTPSTLITFFCEQISWHATIYGDLG